MTKSNGKGQSLPFSSNCVIFLAGINKKIAVNAAYFPLMSAAEPRAIGRPQDPHGNTMLSCLSSGFLCPLKDTNEHSSPAALKPGRETTNPET